MNGKYVGWCLGVAVVRFSDIIRFNPGWACGLKDMDSK